MLKVSGLNPLGGRDIGNNFQVPDIVSHPVRFRSIYLCFSCVISDRVDDIWQIILLRLLEEIFIYWIEKDFWRLQDLNPQPSDLIHEKLDHRTTVYCQQHRNFNFHLTFKLSNDRINHKSKGIKCSRTDNLLYEILLPILKFEIFLTIDLVWRRVNTTKSFKQVSFLSIFSKLF